MLFGTFAILCWKILFFLSKQALCSYGWETHLDDYHGKNTGILQKKNRQVVDLQRLSGLKCWGTRTRTKNDRTRICSVTITPYPTVFARRTPLFSICACKGTTFSRITKTFRGKNIKKRNFSAFPLLFTRIKVPLHKISPIYIFNGANKSTC